MLKKLYFASACIDLIITHKDAGGGDGNERQAGRGRNKKNQIGCLLNQLFL